MNDEDWVEEHWHPIWESTDGYGDKVVLSKGEDRTDARMLWCIEIVPEGEEDSYEVLLEQKDLEDLQVAIDNTLMVNGKRHVS